MDKKAKDTCPKSRSSRHGILEPTGTKASAGEGCSRVPETTPPEDKGASVEVQGHSTANVILFSPVEGGSTVRWEQILKNRGNETPFHRSACLKMVKMAGHLGGSVG
ncbi:unnamed protein product [Gulo gulo]|uniref:Uncharacterized protein n=1 Tax=Gulo gulo TaxID=48420 RepID=A0A9X9LCK1_GULGU|nr:unnamed protein product [Gulo gulo]